MTAPSSPPVRYTGGKWRIARWIIDQFPIHTIYVEPFCGGASVLFRKPPSFFEVINDLNGDVVNFFDVLRSRPAELIAAIDLTPYAREEYVRSYDRSAEIDPIEQARRFYVRCRQSFASGEGSHATGWRFQRSRNRGKRIIDEWNQIDHLWAAARRLKEVMIENDDAFKLFPRFDTPQTLFYVDPPYLPSTRGKNNDYSNEMSETDHTKLAAVLHDLEGMIVLSGYPSPLYENLYAGWRCVETSVQTNGKGSCIEKLWISPSCDVIERLPLFQGIDHAKG